MDNEKYIIESYSREQINNLIATSERTLHGLPMIEGVDADGNREVYAVARGRAERWEAMEDYCKINAWTYSPAFLANTTGYPEDIFKQLRDIGEDANNVVLAIIKNSCGMDSFVEAAVNEGVGPALGRMDGKEVALENGYCVYLLYRIRKLEAAG